MSSWLDDLQARADQFVAFSDGGVALACVEGDQVSFYCAGGFGPEDQRLIAPDTQFQIGSITKIFTSVLFARSERLGLIERNDPAAKYLLEADDAEFSSLSKITLLHLATHHSGLPREPSDCPPATFVHGYPFARYTQAQLVEAFRSDARHVSCDLIFNYSNFGFALLGQALANAWGKKYPDLLQDQVLKSLGMEEAVLATPGTRPAENLALGHSNGKPIEPWTFGAAAPAVGLRSTVRELAGFCAWRLASGNGATSEDLAETMKPLRKTDYGFVGMGWNIVGEGQHAMFLQSGGLGGCRSFIGLAPSRMQAVVVLTNTLADVDSLGCSLLNIEVPAPRPVKTSNAQEYVGLYPLSPLCDVKISEVQEALYFQVTRQAGGWLKPLGQDHFAVAGIPGEVRFSRDDRGRVQALAWSQLDNQYIGRRRDLPLRPEETLLPDTLLASYLGNYLLEVGGTIAIRITGDGLRAQIIGQPETGLFPVAEDEFSYREIEARIRFLRDPTGDVGGLILSQDGRKIVGKKA
jgi:serine-type D-Ala-D-Ala carboxypeptidase/endopeptidase